MIPDGLRLENIEIKGVACRRDFRAAAGVSTRRTDYHHFIGLVTSSWDKRKVEEIVVKFLLFPIVHLDFPSHKLCREAFAHHSCPLPVQAITPSCR
jgi:hypothetical protein